MAKDRGGHGSEKRGVSALAKDHEKSKTKVLANYQKAKALSNPSTGEFFNLSTASDHAEAADRQAQKTGSGSDHRAAVAAHEDALSDATRDGDKARAKFHREAAAYHRRKAKGG